MVYFSSKNLRALKQELDYIESNSIDIPRDHLETANVCSRCRQPFSRSFFGLSSFFKTNEFCDQCGFKVCQKCKIKQNFDFNKNSGSKSIWLCTYCDKFK